MEIGGIPASLPIYLPSAGTLTLNWVTIDVSTGKAAVDSEDVEFVGEITR